MPFARSRRAPGWVSRIASGLPGDVRRALKIIGGQPVVGIEMKYDAGRGRLERIRIDLADDRDDRVDIIGTLNLVSARS